MFCGQSVVHWDSKKFCDPSVVSLNHMVFSGQSVVHLAGRMLCGQRCCFNNDSVRALDKKEYLVIIMDNLSILHNKHML